MRLIDGDALFTAFENAAWYDNNDRDLVAEDILMDAPTIEPVRGEWISVKDRLPDVGKCVLLRHTYHALLGEHGEYEPVTIGYLHQPTDRRRKPYFYWAAVSDYGDMVRADSICPGSKYITHWMPLPEPPKEDDA